ncbi:putative UDP-glucoronosyl and UDP-glucosyl transferase [Trypanosoma rangeli]|uniref:Putative UDP-glucoronosyl and UDP-glucosyl transferase n=1 Tax=Trypanosoma rangeli TaxID=5698 RepID=A0A3S5IRM5_TRYRA|nr:putative UDP-glucoronosyl and UDP-glucosyl transferase [Trypanosoma rangeli]RNF07656.1 putative UDP-glucoronosyl and UDP-glucosyl transferase [Trypanosoma rangeli]|eukprot:RNF07656.1 putative UDP-glucoronosyl and UDP-glucosyl transferase [Trypanosoma rangeli]
MELVFLGIDGLEFGVVPFPERDRFTMMSGITEELCLRGHKVSVYVPESFMKECLRIMGVECVSIGEYNQSYTKEKYGAGMLSDLRIFVSNEHTRRNFNIFFALGLKTALKKAHSLPDGLIVDIETWGVDTLARSLHIPSIFLWSSPQWPVQMNPSFPSPGSGLSVRMSGMQRLKNYFVQRLNYWIAKMQNTKMDGSYESFETLLYRRHIIAPFVFGLDVAQPFCPNVHSVGFLSPRSRETESINSIWMAWMNGCTDGILYISLGYISRFPSEWTRALYESVEIFTKNTLMCVLWELPDDMHASLRDKNNETRFRIFSSYLVSQRSILKHKNTKAFLTHCGGTSVYEAVKSGVPILGLGFSPDRMDICVRARNAGLGVVLDKGALHPAYFINEVMQIKDNLDIFSNLTKIRRMGYVMGGSRRAADVVELVVSLGIDNEDFFCRFTQLPFIEQHDLDVLFAISGVVAMVIFAIVKVICRGKLAKETHRKQD